MPTSWISLIVVVLAVVPGFLATTTWSRARTWRGPSGDLRTILQSLAFSAALQVLIWPLTLIMVYPIRTSFIDHPRRVALWLLIAVLVAPVVMGLLSARMTDLLFPPTGRPWLDQEMSRWKATLYKVVRPAPPPSAWDTLFLADPPHGKFISLQFKDGTQVGGVFSEGSVAMTTPDPHGLFLAEEWILDEDGNFREPVSNSGGLLIRHLDEVRWIRIQDPAAEEK